MDFSLRTVRYDHPCESVLNKIELEYGDSAIVGLEWALSRKPEEWFQIPGTTLYMARTFDPLIRVYYTFDDSVVTVHQIDFEP